MVPILKTTNSGINWVEQYSGTETFYSVDFVDVNEGWAVGEDGIVRHTINGGQTWPEQYSAGSDLKSVFFLNENYGWAVGRYSSIIHTSTGGVNWVAQTSPSFNPLESVFFVNENERQPPLVHLHSLLAKRPLPDLPVSFSPGRRLTFWLLIFPLLQVSPRWQSE